MNTLPMIPGGTLVQGPNARGGNMLYRVATPDGDLALKLYRQRKAAWRAPFRRLAHAIEGKRGTSPSARCETERRTLECWQRHGFSAPRWMDRPCPDDVNPPFLWMTWLAGVVLRTALEDPDVGSQQKSRWMEALADSMSARHTCALAEREPLLIPEHPHVQHVIVHEDSVSVFDHEGGYAPRYPIRQAIAAELAGTVRSALRAAPNMERELVTSFVMGYKERDRAVTICKEALEGRGITRRVHRWDDERRRPDFSKAKALRMLLGAFRTAT